MGYDALDVAFHIVLRIRDGLHATFSKAPVGSVFNIYICG